MLALQIEIVVLELIDVGLLVHKDGDRQYA